MRISKTCVSADNSPLPVTDREIRRLPEYSITSRDELFLSLILCTCHIWEMGNRLRWAELSVCYLKNYPLTPMALFSHNCRLLILLSTKFSWGEQNIPLKLQNALWSLCVKTKKWQMLDFLCFVHYCEGLGTKVDTEGGQGYLCPRWLSQLT